jgi:hypothetical protein
MALSYFLLLSPVLFFECIRVNRRILFQDCHNHLLIVGPFRLFALIFPSLFLIFSVAICRRNEASDRNPDGLEGVVWELG